jgi:excisionase family DNA binding protein
MTAVASNLKLVTPQEAAERLGVSLRRVHQFLADGRLGQPLGGVYVITEDDLREFAKQPREPGRPSKQRAG